VVAFSLDQQILMIGNEMNRAAKLLATADRERLRSCYERVLRLTDLTVATRPGPGWPARLSTDGHPRTKRPEDLSPGRFPIPAIRSLPTDCAHCRLVCYSSSTAASSGSGAPAVSGSAGGGGGSKPTGGVTSISWYR